MKRKEVIEVDFKSDPETHTGSARRSPKCVEQQLTGCTLTELMERSEAITEVLKRILQDSAPLPKNVR